MRTPITMALAIALYATSANAIGVDLDFGACPGNTGVATEATIDCASGAAFPIYVTFEPAESYPDLVWADAILDVLVTHGDLASSANFWDFGALNPAGLTGSQARPAAGCPNYLNTWSPPGSGIGFAAVVRSPTQLRIAVEAYRPSNLSVAADQKLFGFRLGLETATGTEAGRTAKGCALPVTIVVASLQPGTASGTVPILLTAPSENHVYCEHLNGADTPCAAVAVLRHTWGQLKSLYR